MVLSLCIQTLSSVYMDSWVVMKKAGFLFFFVMNQVCNPWWHIVGRFFQILLNSLCGQHLAAHLQGMETQNQTEKEREGKTCRKVFFPWPPGWLTGDCEISPERWWAGKTKQQQFYAMLQVLRIENRPDKIEGKDVGLPSCGNIFERARVRLCDTAPPSSTLNP